MAKTKEPATVYEMKITLRGIKPPIWRRVQVKDCSLAGLHDVIQTCMGWHDGHLHEFEVAGERYGDPSQWAGDSFGDEEEVGNEKKFKLGQLVDQGVKKLRYVYDMGDNWEHDVQIEKVLPAEPGVDYPRCVAGKRAGPPEDCGGQWGYGDFLKAVQDPKHPEHEEMLEWVGGEFDPEAFDCEAVNKMLR